jgi:hypothetical protein
MISLVLDVEDLADTRFAVSPLHETVLSLRVLLTARVSWPSEALACCSPTCTRTCAGRTEF